MSIQVDSGYLLASVHDPNALQEALAISLREPDLLGTLIIAPEGLNWSLCGQPDALDAFRNVIQGLHLGGVVRNTRTPANELPFEKLKLRTRRELVTSGLDRDSLPGASGTHIAPPAFNALLDEPGMRLIDVRNQYEIEIGTFRQAENPQTHHFVDFAAFVDNSLDAADKSFPIALCCTGGIRCERASQLLLSKGFKRVYQLAGGILAYLKAVPSCERRFEGECFVFDGRVTVTKDLQPGNYLLNGAHIESKQNPRGSNYSKIGSSASQTMSLISP